MIRLGLESICYLCDKLDNPQDKLRFIHIAGTNGKGSTGAYIASILRKTGMTVGHYTSPAVFLREEIIKVNNKNISKDDYDEGLEYIDSICETIKEEGKDVPTEFERLTAMAFRYFLKKNCDIVVLECGMGGETDATNVIKNTLAAVFTPISMDHTDYLGETLEDIAKVKSGIIKTGCVGITIEQPKEVLEVLNMKAKEKEASFYTVNSIVTKSKIDKIDGVIKIADNTFDINLNKDSISLLGINQFENASLAISAVYLIKDYIKNITGKELSLTAIKNGLKEVKWPGRFEKICDKPVIIIDGAHNEGAAIRLRENIEYYYKNKHIISIVGMLVNKDHDAVLKQISQVTDVMLTVSTSGDRGYSSQELSKDAIKHIDNVSAIGGIQEALDIAYLMAKPADVILVCGTLSLLKEVKKWKDIKKL